MTPALLPQRRRLILAASGRPAGPPPDRNAAPLAPSDSDRQQPPKRALLGAAIAVLVALVASVLIVQSLRGGDDDQVVAGAAAGEVFLEPASFAGTDPFIDAFPDLVDAPVLAFVEAASPPEPTNAEILDQVFAGKEPGLYGGTGDNAACNTVALVAFLEENPAKAAAWAAVQGVAPSEIDAFVDGLTSVQLTADTRVTNHGFRDGEAYSLQSVLQAGTAVLVDDAGIPRVKCGCGNPLNKPVPQTTVVTYQGPAWEGFEPEAVATVVDDGSTESFVLRDLDTGTTITRMAGTNGEVDELSSNPAPRPTAAIDVAEDLVAVPTTAPTTTVPRATTAPPATEPLVPVDITASGTVTANSTYSGFSTAAAIDGDPSTSWFSIGPSAGDAVFTWTAERSLLNTISIIGNGDNANPDFRTGFGFEQVTIEVFDGGVSTFSTTVGLSGTPDPGTTVLANAMGDTVQLTFTGHESTDCGGFGELYVEALQ